MNPTLRVATIAIYVNLQNETMENDVVQVLFYQDFKMKDFNNEDYNDLA